MRSTLRHEKCKRKGLPALLIKPQQWRSGQSRTLPAHRWKAGNMTIGIGAACGSGTAVMMAADTKGTYNDPRYSDTLIGKQYDFFPHHLLAANIAGTVPVCQSLMSHLVAEMDKLVGLPVIRHDHVRNAVKESQIAELLDRLDYEMVNQLGMRLSEWKKFDKTSLLFRRAQRLVRRFQLPMQLIVGGFVGGSLVLLETQFNDPPEMKEYSCIGSGALYADNSLAKRNQGANTSFQRTIVHVAEAMEAARADKDVGDPADYVLITHRAYRRFPARDQYLMQLLLKYKDKDTDELDDSNDAGDKFRDALFFPGTTREEYAKGMRRPMGAGLPRGDTRTWRMENHWKAMEWSDGKMTFSLPRMFTEPIHSERDNESLNNHTFLVADCKTLGCWVHLVVRHLGLYDPQGNYTIPAITPLRLYCNLCYAANDYGQHDLKFIRGPKPTNDFKAAC